MNLWSQVWWYICDPSTKEAETGKSQIQGHPGIHSKTLSKKKGYKVMEAVRERSSVHELVRGKNFPANFAVVPQNANVTATVLSKVISMLSKALNYRISYFPWF